MRRRLRTFSATRLARKASHSFAGAGRGSSGGGGRPPRLIPFPFHYPHLNVLGGLDGCFA